MTPPTPEELLRISIEVAVCAASWEPASMLIGNVRAEELLALAHAYQALLAERDRLRAKLDYLQVKCATWNGDTYDMPPEDP